MKKKKTLILDGLTEKITELKAMIDDLQAGLKALGGDRAEKAITANTESTRKKKRKKGKRK
jgi:hypothetical protein